MAIYVVLVACCGYLEGDFFCARVCLLFLSVFRLTLFYVCFNGGIVYLARSDIICVVVPANSLQRDDN